MGRTGKLFAYQNYGVEPDVMTLAKALGNGVPIGAIVAKGKAAEVLKPGLHASTFGGNFLATRAGIEVIKEMTKPGFMEEVREKGQFLLKELEKLRSEFPELIKEVRGLGLMLGLVLTRECSKIVEKALSKGLIVNCTAGNVLRLLPPLVISKEEIEVGISILKEVLKEDES
jgi:acetylornithine/succinyldiaminopimelate/putrescine aminotransferase